MIEGANIGWISFLSSVIRGVTPYHTWDGGAFPVWRFFFALLFLFAKLWHAVRLGGPRNCKSY